tara:strand:- start:3177 stop:3932 length:756 start_codon:yes stop_codon:yes gene_type:complete
LFKYIESKLKLFILLICAVYLVGCQGDSKNSNLELSNFIKPEYSFKESVLNCKLIEGKTLNSVERFIPKFVDSFAKMGKAAEELYFLFPIVEDEIDTQVFEVLLKHSDPISLDKLNLTLAALSFDNIATCESSSVSSRSLWLTNKTILTSPVISEILDCKYLEGFNYATMKLVLEQFTNALIKNNAQVDILYSDKELSSKFYWTNIFSSLESRQNFVESWQALEVSKEMQELLLEQSICQSSKTYRRYQIL